MIIATEFCKEHNMPIGYSDERYEEGTLEYLRNGYGVLCHACIDAAIEWPFQNYPELKSILKK